jgi:hypothetical protein
MAYTEMYCNASTGSNMSGGSDESTSPPYSATNGGWNSGTGVFTPTSGDPSAVSPTLVGQMASVFTDGATTPVFVGRVTAVSSTTVTVSTSAKSGTAPTTAASGISINVGGVWKGPNGTDQFPLNFVGSAQTNAAGEKIRINMKGGTNYAVTAAVTASLPGIIQGYTTTAGDGGRATIDGGTSGASYSPLTLTGSNMVLADMIVQNNGATGSAVGLTVSAAAIVSRVVVNNVRGPGFQTSSGTSTRFVECESYANNASNTATAGGFQLTNSCMVLRCIAHDNTGSNSTGFELGAAGIVAIDCISDTNGGHGFNTTSNGDSIINCVAYNNGGSGILIGGNTSQFIENCILVSNALFGINGSGSTRFGIINNCAFYSNTSGATGNVGGFTVTGSITLTGDPFAGASTGDFDLNNTASAGASCRAAGRGNFTQTASSYTGTLSVPDVGASQITSAGGGGGSGVSGSRIFTGF